MILPRYRPRVEGMAETKGTDICLSLFRWLWYQTTFYTMNRHTRLQILAGLGVLIVAFIVWWPRTEPPLEANNIATPVPAPDNSGATTPPTAGPMPQQRQTEGGRFGDLATLSAVPIEFYGKVVDQEGKPLAGVEITGGTGSSTGFMQQETRSYKTTTDGNGLFTFGGFRGDALILELKKPGYNFESDRIRFHYSPMNRGVKRFTPERAIP